MIFVCLSVIHVGNKRLYRIVGRRVHFLHKTGLKVLKQTYECPLSKTSLKKTSRCLKNENVNQFNIQHAIPSAVHNERKFLNIEEEHPLRS